MTTYTISADAKFGAQKPTSEQSEWQREANGWTVALTIRADGGWARTMTVDYWMGHALSGEPTAADVLACLVNDAASGDDGFEEFCAACGYDTDSRRAYAMWEEVGRQTDRLRTFLGGDVFSELLDIAIERGQLTDVEGRVVVELDD